MSFGFLGRAYGRHGKLGASPGTGVQPADTDAPVIVTLSPADNATNVAINSNLIATFSEPIAFHTTVLISLFLTDDTPVDTWTEADIGGEITISGNTLTINPPSDLTNSAGYYVQITSGSIKDLAGNSFTGITDETTWSFTAVAAGGGTVGQPMGLLLALTKAA